MKDADYRCPSHETFRSENDFLITSVGALYRAHYIVIVPTGSIEFLGNWLGSLPCSSIQELCIGACKVTSFPTLFLTAAVSKSACSNLETLVVSDRRLGESLLLFNSSLGFHINWTIDSAFPRLTTLRVVWRRACAGFDLLVGTDDLALLREVHREMRFPFKHLVIESTSWRPGMIDQLSQEVVELFDSVEYKFFDETSSMELPYD
ncbi:hypothetical protein A0H81_08499 [Grifola frondosa]|uniref:Uncharacterized protein n=1 Tax=Grifola frondosa TaxID=5627 RepID=A0A1C7M3L1_GRIFR|nr:hypothetical protein A0H81_08499 [Grifola frondosa]